MERKIIWRGIGRDNREGDRGRKQCGRIGWEYIEIGRPRMGRWGK